jgi:hypothetical protein
MIEWDPLAKVFDRASEQFRLVYTVELQAAECVNQIWLTL